jgi:hypothetical protein
MFRRQASIMNSPQIVRNLMIHASPFVNGRNGAVTGELTIAIGTEILGRIV